MSSISVDYDVLNQKGSPAWYSDTFANIPTPGYKGRMFISIDTFAFYRDNGVGWDLVGGPGTGTITGAGVFGQVTFFSGTDTISGSTDLVWDNTNKRLGINVASPTVTLDISGSVKATALIKSGGTSAQILLADGTTTPTSTFQTAITLTTTGTTGSSTLVAGVLNVPTYTFVSSVNAITLGTSGTDLTSTVANSTTTPTITLNVPTASATNRGALSSADWSTFNNKQATITLTTSGTSGAATLVGATLNIPNYTNVGTVTSVAALTLGTSGTDLSSSVANSTSTPVITLNVPTASATNRGALSSADFTTFNNKQATISVTAPVVLTGATISMPAATTSVNGYLTSTDWNTFNNKSNTNGTVTSVVALTIGTSGIDITSTAVTTTTTPVITLNIPTASASNRGALSSTDWTTFNNKQATLSLTTTGTSGAATLVANTLNVPNYGSALSGYLPLSGGTLTGALNGTSASFSSTISGISIRSSAVGTFGFNTANNGEFQIYATALDGMVMAGRGSTNDMVITNKNGSDVLRIPTGTTGVTLVGALNGTTATFSSTGAFTSYLSASFFDVSGNASPTQFSGKLSMGYYGAGGYSWIQSWSSTPLILNALGNNVGIGGSTAAYQLDVTGTFRATGAASFSNSVGINSTGYGGSKLTLVASTNPTTASSSDIQLSIGESSANTGYSLKIGYVNVGGGYQGTIQSILGSTPYITSINPDGGSVGVGTYAPSDKLDVQGASGVGIRVSNSTNPGYNANLVVNFNDVSTMQLNCLGTTILQSGNTGNTVLASRTTIINVTAITNFTSRGNFLGATDNALFSLNSGGTLYTVGFSPTATASSTNTLTLTTGTTTWIYTGTGTATWTLPNPSGNNQIYWIKNAGTGAITLTAFSGTNIINNSAASVSTISIAVGGTAVIAQDGNVKSYQLQ